MRKRRMRARNLRTMMVNSLEYSTKGSLGSTFRVRGLGERADRYRAIDF